MLKLPPLNAQVGGPRTLIMPVRVGVCIAIHIDSPMGMTELDKDDSSRQTLIASSMSTSSTPPGKWQAPGCIIEGKGMAIEGKSVSLDGVGAGAGLYGITADVGGIGVEGVLWKEKAEALSGRP